MTERYLFIFVRVGDLTPTGAYPQSWNRLKHQVCGEEYELDIRDRGSIL